MVQVCLELAPGGRQLEERRGVGERCQLETVDRVRADGGAVLLEVM
jgi:hypothetical protein